MTEWQGARKQDFRRLYLICNDNPISRVIGDAVPVAQGPDVSSAPRVWASATTPSILEEWRMALWRFHTNSLTSRRSET